MVEQIISPGWVTYLRVSDEDKQTPERSFAMQRQKIKERLITPSGLPFIREYQDILTGTSPNRKDYQQMLSDAEVGKFSHLGLYRADRFGRNKLEGFSAISTLTDLGIKVRVSDMPTLMPETPDGDFFFSIQMILAQREVDVLKERIRDGTEAKMRAGGWPNNAPAGYKNKERQIKSGKYERWVEMDADYNPVIREAWEMLLSDKFTLDQICEELHRRGYTRPSGRPWVWNTPKRGVRKTAKSNLQHIFHNPFFAGWLVSERFGISFGEIRGKWEPTVTTDEFNKGIDILRKNDAHRQRTMRRFYLLRNLLWLGDNSRVFKMYGSTPSGRADSYSYYITHAKILGRVVRFPCKQIDDQIADWLQGIVVEKNLIPQIRRVYQEKVQELAQDDRAVVLKDLQQTRKKLKDEEAQLGRLLITGQISQESYERLREEWQEKRRNTERNILDLERDTIVYLDDLDTALILMSKMGSLFNRLVSSQKLGVKQDYAPTPSGRKARDRC